MIYVQRDSNKKKQTNMSLNASDMCRTFDRYLALQQPNCSCLSYSSSDDMTNAVSF